MLAIAEAALRISRGTKTTFSYWGMVAAHLGLAVTIVGIAFSQNYSVERDVRMKSGDSVDIHEYRFTFRDVKEVSWPELAWRCGDYRRNARWQAGNGAVCGKTLLQHCRVDDDRSGD